MSEVTEGKKDLEVLWTIAQVAKYFLISKSTVYHWIAEGTTIDPTKIIRIGNRVRIPRSEVERIAGIIKNEIKQQ